MNNKDNKNNNKGFQGTCDTRFAWQVKLDLWFAVWVLPFIDGICLFTRHVWPCDFKLFLGENASTAPIWWPFSGNTDAFHLKPVAIQLCRQNLLPFDFNVYSFTCAATKLRPFLFIVTLHFF